MPSAPETRTGRPDPVLQGPDPKAAPRLYPAIEPYKCFHLPVGDGHELHVELCGTPGASPVVVLHGGPGPGSARSCAASSTLPAT